MIGVLALQGNYRMHSKMLFDMNEKNLLVRDAQDLLKCKGLIIPGGESTVISKMMIRYNLLEPIKKFSQNNGIFGTCAGLIIMSNYDSDNIKTLNIINIDISRNAWGRQINSFTKDIKINLNQTKKVFSATFIRAPRIERVRDNTDTLAYLNKEPVMVRKGRHIGTTFHPEMHEDSSIHKYFLEINNGR